MCPTSLGPIIQAHCFFPSPLGWGHADLPVISVWQPHSVCTNLRGGKSHISLSCSTGYQELPASISKYLCLCMATECTPYTYWCQYEVKECSSPSFSSSISFSGETSRHNWKPFCMHLICGHLTHFLYSLVLKSYVSVALSHSTFEF